MIKLSFKTTPFEMWEAQAPTVLTLAQIIIATADTSAHAERTFSLARRLKTYLRQGMNDETFDALGLMGWYKDEIDKMLDSINIGNNFINHLRYYDQ